MITNDELFRLSKECPESWVFKSLRLKDLGEFTYVYGYENIIMAGSTSLTKLAEVGYISFTSSERPSHPSQLQFDYQWKHIVNITFKGMWLMWNIESLRNNASNTKTN